MNINSTGISDDGSCSPCITAKIYRYPKSATQSGVRKSHDWVVEFDRSGLEYIEPMMGWTASYDTDRQLFLKFDTMDEAIRFVTSKKIDYIVIPSNFNKKVKKSYANNFKKKRD